MKRIIIHIGVSRDRIIEQEPALCGSIAAPIVTLTHIQEYPLGTKEKLCLKCVAHEDYPLLLLAALE